jgi:glutamine synthetase
MLVPDPTTFRIYPYAADPSERTGCFFCNVHNPDRSPFAGSPRNVLMRLLEKAYGMGFDGFYVAPELEFFLFRMNGDDISPLPYDRGGYFDSGTNDPADSIKKKMMLALRALGIDVEYAHHEVAPGQHELDFRYGPALETADRTMLFKHVVKAVALDNGAHATFMPKPLHGQNGSGMHTHFSLWKDGKNLFYDPQGEPYHMSKIGRSFIAGILEHVREFTAILNPLVNSYKRIIPGYEAPVYISWASINRSALVRVPAVKAEKEPTGRRAEIRSPDPSCNPYLAFAVLLAAGLDGIERGLEPPAPVDKVNLFEMGDKQRRAEGIVSLPGSLEDSLKDLQRSSFMKDVLGEHLYEKYLEAKWKEWDVFREAVTDWELKTYLHSV